MKFYLFIFVALVSFLAGFLTKNYLPSSRIEESMSLKKHENYPFLAQRIFLNDPNDTIINFTRLRNDLKKYTDNSPNFIGIYFEYLPTGTTIAINDKEVLFAASLTKIPLVMEVIKRIENGKISEDEKLTITRNNIDKNFGTLWKKDIGAQVTVKEAIKYTVVESDNTAFQMLKERLGNSDLLEIFNYLDIPQQNAGPGRGITTKNFSSVLISLYFSAYLPYEKSNTLLSLMSEESKDNDADWIRKGVPQNVKISNKFGIYESIDQNDRVYSDCGIVYAPKRNYSLCVMVKGAPDQIVAGNEIGDISKKVYDYVTSQ